MKQMSLQAPMTSGFELYRSVPAWRLFLEQMDRVVPWAELVALIEPYAPQADPQDGRPAFAVETLLRIHVLQSWFGLSDPAVEEALYDTPLLATFVGLDLGVDAASGLVHTMVATAANVSDVTQAHRLVHGQESDVLADAGYQGVDKRAENQGKPVTWHVAMRRAKRRALDTRTPLGWVRDALERIKARMCPKVSMRLRCSNASLATARRCIEAWPRTARSATSCVPWSICGWRAKPCWRQQDKCARSSPNGGRMGLPRAHDGGRWSQRRFSV